MWWTYVVRFAAVITITACILVGCSSDSPTASPLATGNAGCTAIFPSTSSPQQETVMTISPGDLPLVFDMSPHPARVCPGGTVVVQVKITNAGSETITGAGGRLIMGCGAPPELVVGQVGPIDVPARGSVATTATFTVPLFAPGSCGFSVYGYPHTADITVAAPGT
jgi:hypothetical protein